MLWNAVTSGPDDTLWDEVYADGSIYLDILQNQWSPIYDVAAILTSIQSLLCDPNPNSPANSEAARMFSENKREYNRKVREIVEQSWTADWLLLHSEHVTGDYPDRIACVKLKCSCFSSLHRTFLFHAFLGTLVCV